MLLTGTSPSIIAAIDPGATGAIVVAESTGNAATPRVISVSSLAADHEISVLAVSQALTPHLADKTLMVFIERSFIMPGSSVIAGGNYLAGYGVIIGALLALGIADRRIVKIRPQDWQKHIPGLIPPEARTKQARQELQEWLDAHGMTLAKYRKDRRKIIKENSREIASRMFPAFAPELTKVSSDGKADALLIAQFAHLAITGKVSFTHTEKGSSSNGRKKIAKTA